MVRLGLFLVLGVPVLVGLLHVLMGGDAFGIRLEDIYAGWGVGGHLLGADDVGRDVLARAARAVGTSLAVAASVGAVTGVVGIGLGLVSGWRGGWVDLLVGRLADVVVSFPGLLLALALAALLGPAPLNVVIALGCLGWVGFYKLTRVQVLALRGRPFVLAAELGGVRPVRRMVRHVLPNCASVLVVEAVVVVAGSLVAEAGLSFLGLGVPPPLPSLGGMIRDGMRAMLVAPQLVVVPGVLLISLVVGANLLAEGLRRRWAGAKEGP